MVCRWLKAHVWITLCMILRFIVVNFILLHLWLVWHLVDIKEICTHISLSSQKLRFTKLWLLLKRNKLTYMLVFHHNIVLWLWTLHILFDFWVILLLSQELSFILRKLVEFLSVWERRAIDALDLSFLQLAHELYILEGVNLKFCQFIVEASFRYFYRLCDVWVQREMLWCTLTLITTVIGVSCFSHPSELTMRKWLLELI